MGPEPEQVRGDPLELGEERAQKAGPRRRLDSEQPLDRAHVGEMAGDGRRQIQMIEEREPLPERPRLEQLLQAAMEMADHRPALHDPLVLHPQPQDQHALDRGVLGPEAELQLVAQSPVPSTGKSLRRGWPSKPSQRRRRLRSGCPSKRTPKRSHTSRSGQSAARQTPVTEGTGVASPAVILTRTRRPAAGLQRW